VSLERSTSLRIPSRKRPPPKGRHATFLSFTTSFLFSPSSSSFPLESEPSLSVNLPIAHPRLNPPVTVKSRVGRNTELFPNRKCSYAKCITKPGLTLSPSDEGCITRCSDRFLEACAFALLFHSTDLALPSSRHDQERGRCFAKCVLPWRFALYRTITNLRHCDFKCNSRYRLQILHHPRIQRA
jgi:hypothetical protein